MRSAAAITGVGIVLIAVGVAKPAPPAADFPSRLESTLKQVAGYEVVGDLVTPTALADLVNSTHGKPLERRQLAKRLAGLLASNAPVGAKELACRQLSLIGTAEEVPALAGLLTDEELAHMARLALERIPDKAADQALRQGLAKTQGRRLAGVVASIGVRRDAEAVEPLKKLLFNADADVAAAAAQALGRIGGPAAIEALFGAISGARGPVLGAVSDACLLATEELARQGERERAMARVLYDRLRGTDIPQPVRRAAIRGAILARQSAGVPLLADQLKASDEDLFALGLGLVHEMPGDEVAKRAASVLAGLSGARQIRLVQALADRGDRAAGPAVLALAEKGDAEVRAAAILGLARLGDASHVPMLVQAAGGAASDIAEPAMVALVSIPAKPVDAALLALLSDPDPKTRHVVIVALGQRRAASAVPALFQAADDREPSVRLAAIKALGNTVKLTDMGRLAGLLLKTPGPAEQTAVEEAIASAAAGMSDKDGCADKLIALSPQADPEGRSALLRTLSQIGGPKALGSVLAAMGDPNPEIQDAAVRALSNWTTAEAAEALAQIAKGSSNRKHQILALRGYIRLIGLPEVAPEEKLRRSGRAMELAERDDERRLVLGALGNVGTKPALDRVLSYLDHPTLKNEAAAAAIANGYRLLRSSPAVVAQAMTRVIAAVENKNVKKRAQDLLNRCK